MKIVQAQQVIFYVIIGATLLSANVKGQQTSRAGAKKDMYFPGTITRFTPYGNNPVFEGTGEILSWDKQIRERGYIIFDDGLYKMWYTGYNGGDTTIKSLGYATSRDGVHWARYSGNPVFNKKWTEDMCVVKYKGMYYMFAEGRHDIAHALISKDGIHWEDEGDLDIRTTKGDRVEGPYGTPAVWVENDKWYLFYEHNDEAIWLAESTDRKIWKHVQDEPVMKPGPDKYDAAAIAADQIVKYGGKYYMYYHASSDANWSKPGAGSIWTSNIAVSNNLIHWDKYLHNPLVEGDHSSPVIVFDGKKYRLYTMHNKVFLYFSK